LTLASFRGKPLLVTLFYNNCTSVCPMLTAQLQTLERQLSPRTRGDITVLMISLDPTHDTPEALRRFKQEHRIDNLNWVVARTDAVNVRVLAATLGIQYRELPDHSFNHSTVITLADQDGRVAARSVGPGAVDAAFLRRVRAIAAAGAANRRDRG
jgi:protein SCO1/2